MTYVAQAFRPALSAMRTLKGPRYKLKADG
jgi:hypothetical protein